MKDKLAKRHTLVYFEACGKVHSGPSKAVGRIAQPTLRMIERKERKLTDN